MISKVELSEKYFLIFEARWSFFTYGYVVVVSCEGRSDFKLEMFFDDK